MLLGNEALVSSSIRTMELDPPPQDDYMRPVMLPVTGSWKNRLLSIPTLISVYSIRQMPSLILCVYFVCLLSDSRDP